MAEFRELFQTADWKKEKHVPVIECAATAALPAPVVVTVSVGKEIAHPNTTEHHIRWIEIYFQPDGDKFPYMLARCEFSAHGESAQGPNTTGLLMHPKATLSFQAERSGTVFAASYCNIHGLWQSAARLEPA